MPACVHYADLFSSEGVKTAQKSPYMCYIIHIAHRYTHTPLQKFSNKILATARKDWSVPNSVFCEDKKSLIPSELDQADRSNFTTEETMNFQQTTAASKNLLPYQKYWGKKKYIDLVPLRAKAKLKSITAQTIAH